MVDIDDVNVSLEVQQFLDFLLPLLDSWFRFMVFVIFLTR